MKRWVLLGLLLSAIFVVAGDHTSIAMAQEPAAAPETAAAAAPSPGAEPASDAPDNAAIAYSLDNVMLFLCAVLVIFMQAGFAMVEVGLNSAKNCVNILFKNTIDFCIGVILYFFIGYALMYPGADYAGKYFGFTPPDFSAAVPAEEIQGGKLHPQVDFLFQAAFCATTATIVSGAVAGRMKFTGYLVYTCIITALVYPISGMWKWGGGWLAAKEFHDFAGSIVVHAVGGFAGLMGAIALGPRIGRYNAEGKPVPWPGHNLAFTCLGVFILMIGWYGFNPGSQLAFTGGDNTAAVATIAVNTTLGACAGGVVGMLMSWGMFGKPDLTLALNGILGGLVGVTANCDCITNHEALLIGAIAGAICLLAVVGLDKLKIDDPVGAFPVHGACGVWGGIATGIFGEGKDLTVQVIGTVSCVGWSVVTMGIVFFTLKALGMLRVSAEEEIEGLDINEHGQVAYGLDPK